MFLLALLSYYTSAYVLAECWLCLSLACSPTILLCLYSMIYRCSTLLCLPSTANVPHRSACLRSNWHLWPLSLLALSTTYPDHWGRHRLKHNAPPLKTHLNTSLCTIDMISHSSIWPSWRMWALGGLGVPKKESITEINQTAREGRDRQQTSDDQCEKPSPTKCSRFLLLTN